MKNDNEELILNDEPLINFMLVKKIYSVFISHLTPQSKRNLPLPNPNSANVDEKSFYLINTQEKSCTF